MSTRTIKTSQWNYQQNTFVIFHLWGIVGALKWETALLLSIRDLLLIWPFPRVWGISQKWFLSVPKQEALFSKVSIVNLSRYPASEDRDRSCLGHFCVFGSQRCAWLRGDAHQWVLNQLGQTMMSQPRDSCTSCLFVLLYFQVML